MAVSLEHLVRYHEDGNDFLFRIVTGDEMWVHHFTPESKAASMEWKHPSSPVRKKFKTTPSAAINTAILSVSGLNLIEKNSSNSRITDALETGSNCSLRIIQALDGLVVEDIKILYCSSIP
ncbi:histone-lysine N-methyltransferase SETMAR [Trichonephila clavata]|uniref:Histone-lysine N-methyltransferase SETMAR n=1 Tax=Trichonephila clavata TaxID=2740835 RepID=A0A8X6IC32_TRICU|nr:histone-lysine N-methyltransferase SETMAR [Trichonephila clavata]